MARSYIPNRPRRPRLLDTSITDSWFCGKKKPNLIMNNNYQETNRTRNISNHMVPITQNDIFNRSYDLIGGSQSLYLKESFNMLYKHMKENIWTLIGCIIVLMSAYIIYRLRLSYLTRKKRVELQRQHEAKLNNEISDDISELEEELTDETQGLDPNISRLGIDLQVANVHDDLPTMNFHPNPEPLPTYS